MAIEASQVSVEHHPGKQMKAYSPVVALVGLHRDRGAVALHEVVRVVNALESAPSHHGVDVRTDLENSPLELQDPRRRR